MKFSLSERFISVYADNRLRWSFGVCICKCCFPVQLHSLVICIVCNNYLFIYFFIASEETGFEYSSLPSLQLSQWPIFSWVPRKPLRSLLSSNGWHSKGWEGVSNTVFLWRNAQMWISSFLALQRRVANIGILQSSSILDSPWLLRSEWAEVDVFIGSLLLISLF